MDKPLVILKLGGTFPDLAARRGDFEHWIAAGLEAGGLPVRTIDVPGGEPLPDCDGLAGVVVSGSHQMVAARLDWSEKASQWLARLVEREVPLLAICYGHQLLAHALGGRVADNPRGREFGTVRLALAPEAADDPLLRDLPDPLLAQACHAQSVVELPPGARLLASSAKDPHQAYRVGQWAWGVQFHPEFDRETAAEYVRRHGGVLRREGQDPERIEAEIVETPQAAEVLRRFARLAARRARPCAQPAAVVPDVAGQRNVELKARLADPGAARRTAEAIATRRLGAQEQVDTYFHCANGRLKLRQIDGLRAQLVWYARPDEHGPKASRYVLAPVSNPETLKAALGAALGVRGVVRKRREVFLWHNVRIHLDEVEGLGSFLEFEAVLGPDADETAGRAQVEELLEKFSVTPADLLPASYADMQARRSGFPA